MKIEIVPATAADAESLVTIQKQAFKRLYEIYQDDGSPYLRGTDEFIQWLGWPNTYVYNILADSELVGGVAFWERRMRGLPGEYYLSRIYISPEMQSKGIASSAIALCEATIHNANRWSLDFPIDQIANRRCYEKAGYIDTDKTEEQSEGKIVLAVYAKTIHPFRSLKNQISNSDIRRIMAACVFDNSSEGLDKVVADYNRNAQRQLWGWVENGDIIGVCGFEVHAEYVEILHIAVAESEQKRGIGRAMVNALCEKYKMEIKAETDDDAVEFYRKTGFETTAIQKYNVRRWTCVLSSTETDQERQARIYPIILSEYNPAWTEWFAEEKANLERLIGTENITRISHFGSTSVPGLMAKPTVDILLETGELSDIENLITALPESEYICLREQTMDSPDQVMFIKGYLSDGFADKVFHIHVRRPKDWDELYFRDYLIAHPETAAEYAALKRKLFKDYEHDRDGYTLAKGEFIKTITEKARKEAQI